MNTPDARTRRSLTSVSFFSAILAFLLVAGMVVPAPSVAADEHRRILDDTDLASWTFTGAWDPGFDASIPEDNHTRTQTWSNTMGAKARLQFFGTSVRILGSLVPNGGRYEVTLDCMKKVIDTSNSNSSMRSYRETLAWFKDLQRGWHTVVVEVISPPTADPTANFVGIDAAYVDDLGPVDIPVPEVLWSGPTAKEPLRGPIELRRPGCGSASSLLDAFKARVGDGKFFIPRAGDSAQKPIETRWGRVNAHTSSTDGPVTVMGEAVEAATIPVDIDALTVDMALPDRPRTLILEVVADEIANLPLEFAVVAPDGTPLPLVAKTSQGVERSDATIVLDPGAPTKLIVDLRGPNGAGGYSAVSLRTRADAPAQLDILDGRTTDMSMNRAAHDLFGADAVPLDPDRFTVRAPSFAYGPVVLSRVVADSAQPAWIGDQTTAAANLTTAVELLYGGPTSEERFTVGGVQLGADALGVRIPATADGGPGNVVLRLDTGRRCRSLTAAVGIADGSADDAAWAEIGVYAGGHVLPARHNGAWENGPLSYGSVATSARDRERFVGHLIAAKSAGADLLPSEQRAAVKALIAAEKQFYSASTYDASAQVVTYPIPNPVRIGSGATVNSGAPEFFSGDTEVGVQPLDSRALFPFAVDLLVPTIRDALATAATSKWGSLQHTGAPLVDHVTIVVSGTPGAIVALDRAGLDCVSVESAPIAMPLWSQIGVPPLFLPMPRDGADEPLSLLANSPVWWDTVCPAGLSLKGIQLDSVRVRETKHTATVVSTMPWMPSGTTEVYHLVEEAKATKPACAFPGDVIVDNYGPYTKVSETGHAGHTYHSATTVTTDTVKERFDAIGSTWSDRAIEWMEKLTASVLNDHVGWVLWAVTLPIDPVGALIFNPLTMHAVPIRYQVALGALYLPFAGEAAGGIVRSASHGATTGLMAAERAEELVAAGRGAFLGLGEGERMLVPLTEANVADVQVARTSTRVVSRDHVTILLPEEGHRVPWFHDVGTVTSDEIRMLCRRDAQMLCVEPGGLNTPPEVQPTTEWIPGSGNYPAERLTTTHVDANIPGPLYEVLGTTQRRGYWERYVDAGMPAPLVSNDPAALAAVEATSAMRVNTDIGVLDAYVQTSASAPRVTPLVATDSMPLYRFDSRDPSTVFGTGFDLYPNASTREGWQQYVNIWNSNGPRVHAEWYSLFKSATRDPDLLPAFQSDFLAFHWRYKITRPKAGGGFDIRHTFEQSKDLDPELMVASKHTNVITESEVVFPGGVRREYIERADYMEFNPTTGRMEVVYSVPNPHFDVTLTGGAPSPISSAELSGAKMPMEPWVKFDWKPFGTAGFPEELVAPGKDLLASALGHSGSRVVFLKSTMDWAVIPAWFELTEQQLKNAGFVKGRFPAAGPVDVWIPEKWWQLPGAAFQRF